MMIGDWNRTQVQTPCSTWLAAGLVRSADDCLGDNFPPTRKDGRCIDYAVVSPDVRIEKREQHSGIADHDVVIYEVDVAKQEPQIRRQPPRELPQEVEVDEAEWREAWMYVQDEFREYLDARRTECFHGVRTSK